VLTLKSLPLTAAATTTVGRPSPSRDPHRPGRYEPRGRRRGLRRSGALLLVGALALSACGSDAGDASTSTTKVASPADTTTTAPPASGTVEVHAVDFAYQRLPDRVEAGTKLTLVNDAVAELHELVAFKLADDEERSVAELMELPQAELEAMFGQGPPTMVLLAKPGEPQIEAVGDGTLAEPGRYMIACSIPTGADPDELLEAEGPPPTDAGVPHFHHGMWAEVEVV
jgi:hypothetical protein